MSTSTALKLLALLLASVARSARRERAGRVPGAVRRRGVRAGVRGERGGDVRE
jgi:hypothetical protein